MAANPPEPKDGGEKPAPAGEAPKAVDEALEQAKRSVADLQGQVDQASGAPGATPLEMPTFEKGTPAATSRSIDVLAEVDLDVSIELGRTQMLVEDVLRLEEGAVIELDKLAGDPVDVYVNGRHVARGEVLVLNDNFCVRVSEIVDGSRSVNPPAVGP